MRGKGATPEAALHDAYRALAERLALLDAEGEPHPNLHGDSPPHRAFARTSLTRAVRDVHRSVAFSETFGFHSHLTPDGQAFFERRRANPRAECDPAEVSAYLNDADKRFTLHLVRGEPTPERADTLTFVTDLSEVPERLDALGCPVTVTRATRFPPSSPAPSATPTATLSS